MTVLADRARDLADAVAIYGRLASAQLRAQMQYRVPFFMDMITTFLATATDFIAIALFFLRFKDIGGWRMPEVALLYGLVSTSFAVVDMFGKGFEEFADLVRMGRFDALLIRPRSAILQVLGSELQTRVIGRFVQSIGVLVAACVLLDARSQWSWFDWCFLVLTIFGGALFFAGVVLLSATSCFWTVESVEAANIFTYGSVETGSFPMHIYPAALRRFYMYVVPLAFVCYYPALYLLRKPDPLGLSPYVQFLALPICAAVLWVGLAAWRVGVRHYVSTGS